MGLGLRRGEEAQRRGGAELAVVWENINTVAAAHTTH